MGIHQLRRLEENWKRREAIWNRYREALRDLPLVLPADPAEGTRHGYHLYTVLVDAEEAGISRDAFLGAMTAEGIGVGVHYQSIPSHPYYRDRFGWRPEEHPNALAIGERTLSLPLSPALEDADVEDVIEAVRVILKDGSRA
jgi:dTDP-4-amino-4,6-dideoxygalactose transaminase